MCSVAYLACRGELQWAESSLEVCGVGLEVVQSSGDAGLKLRWALARWAVSRDLVHGAGNVVSMRVWVIFVVDEALRRPLVRERNSFVVDSKRTSCLRLSWDGRSRSRFVVAIWEYLGALAVEIRAKRGENLSGPEKNARNIDVRATSDVLAFRDDNLMRKLKRHANAIV